MKTIQFQEIIECSSQQSLLTGQAGFGIRTLTEGMNYELARSICEQENFAYEVGVASQLTLEAITQDASITRQYPRTLKYLVYPTDNGETKYIVACTTYIGIDISASTTQPRELEPITSQTFSFLMRNQICSLFPNSSNRKNSYPLTTPAHPTIRNSRHCSLVNPLI